jgi:SHS2 domain-containing protein
VVTRAADGGPFARELEHTADLGFEVEAPTLPLLFERAGLALLEVMVDLTGVEVRERVTLEVAADDLDELFHDWLQSLLIRFQAGGFVAAELAVEEVGARTLRAAAGGERIDPSRHRFYTEVKGVTYHQLAVRETGAGWWARVIVDV